MCFTEYFHFPTLRMTFTLEYALLFHSNWYLEHNSSLRGTYTRKEEFDLRMVLCIYFVMHHGNEA